MTKGKIERAPASVISQDTSSKAINAYAKRIRAAYGKSDALVHEGGMAALRHFDAYGDATGLGRIYDAMPKSTRRGLFALWCSRYGGVNVTVKAGSKVSNATKAKEGSKNYKAKPDLEAANVNPWHSMPEVEKEPTVFDFDDLFGLIKSSAARIDRMLKGENDKATVAPADRARAAALVAAVNAIRVAEVVEAPANDTPAQEQDATDSDSAGADIPVQIAA